MISNGRRCCRVDEAVITDVSSSVAYVTTFHTLQSCVWVAALVWRKSCKWKHKTAAMGSHGSRDGWQTSVDEYLLKVWARRYEYWRLMWYASHKTKCKVLTKFQPRTHSAPKRVRRSILPSMCKGFCVGVCKLGIFPRWTQWFHFEGITGLLS